MKKTGNEPICWLGPGVPGRLRTGTVYTDGAPDFLRQAAAESAAVNSLLVPLSQAAQVRAALERGAGAYPALYAKAQEFWKEEQHGDV